jgi:hypothetical protein
MPKRGTARNIGDVGDDTQIMGDDQHGHPKFRLQINDLF